MRNEGSTPGARADSLDGRRDNILDPALDLAADSPVQSYVAFRLETDPHIIAYATASDYTLEEATRDYATAWERGEQGGV